MTNVLVAVVCDMNYDDVAVVKDSDDACAWMVSADPQWGGGEGLLVVVVDVAAVVSPAEVFLSGLLFLDLLSAVSARVYEFLHLKSANMKEKRKMSGF